MKNHVIHGDADTALKADHGLEEACVFGNNAALIGVYTPPVYAHQQWPGLCVLYLTAGLLHHVGPSRLHVELARTLSVQGIAGFRFDLSGTGDSETSSLGGYFTERSVSEIRQAMDYVQREKNHRRFVLLGLCSGADDALATALVDERVAGLCLLNGYAYRAGRFYWHRLLSFGLPRLLYPRKIANACTRAFDRLTHRLKKEGKEEVDSVQQQALQALDDDYRFIPPREETEAHLQQLCDRQIQMLWIYTGSEHEYYTYQGQFASMFPAIAGHSCIQEYYVRQADHTLILKEDRLHVIRRLSDWFATTDFDCFQTRE